MFFLGYLGFRPTVASEVGRPTPRKTIAILPGSRCAAGGLKECRGLPASARGTLQDGAAVGAVGGSDRAAPSHGASARGTGSAGRCRQSSRPHRPTHRAGGSPITGSARTGGLPHRGGDSISPRTPPGSPARTCRTRAVEPDGTGGMVSLGVFSSYRLGYPQNENFHAARQRQSVPAPALKRTGKAHQEC